MDVFSRSVSFQVYSEQLDLIENNPIFILSEVCLRAIIDGDRITPRFILVESNNHLLKLLKEGDHKHRLRETINSFFMMYKPVFNKSAELRQHGVIYTLINVIESIHYFCAENKFQWDTMIELNKELEREILVLLEYNYIELAKEYIWTLERIMQNHLEINTPQQNEIRDFTEGESSVESNYEVDKSLQWHHVAFDYFGIFNRIIEKAIELKKLDFIGSALHVLISIGQNSINSENVEAKKKNVIIRISHVYASLLVIKCADEGLINKDSFIIPFNSFAIEKIIAPDNDYTIDALTSIGNSYIKIAKRNSLPLFMLNEIGAAGRFCISKINDSNIYKNSSMYILNLLIKLYKIISDSTILDKDRFLWEIYHQAKSIRQWFKGDVEKYKDFLNEMDNQISTIEMKVEIKKPQNDEDAWTIF